MSKITNKLTFKAKENENHVALLIIEIELRSTASGIDELSICGEIKNKYGTSIACGQCIDEIREYSDDPLIIKLHTIWKRWHLNCLRAGTERQETFLRQFSEPFDYEESCQLLKDAGLYEDNGVRYGSTWQQEELPEEVRNLITKLCLDCSYYLTYPY